MVAEKPLRFVISDVYAEGKGVIVRGRVVQGFLTVGERVVGPFASTFDFRSFMMKLEETFNALR